MRFVIGVALTIVAWPIMFGPVSHQLRLRFNPPVRYMGSDGNPFVSYGGSWFLESIIAWVALLASIATTALIWVAVVQVGEYQERRRQEKEARQRQRDAEEAARIAERARLAAVVAARLAEEGRRRERLIFLARSSVEAFESLPLKLTRADHELDSAEVTMGERAFAPFWDAVERAAQHLGAFDSATEVIRNNAAEYRKVATELSGRVAQFPISIASVDGLLASRITVVRMTAVVGRAQRDFQFATIYEQRRTNQILIAGFSTLSAALQGLGQRIEWSVQTVRTAIDEMNQNLAGAIRDVGSGLGTDMQAALWEASDESRFLTERLQAAHDSHSAELTKRCEVALVMLDDIRRGRRPLI